MEGWWENHIYLKNIVLTVVRMDSWGFFFFKFYILLGEKMRKKIRNCETLVWNENPLLWMSQVLPTLLKKNCSGGLKMKPD